MGNKITLLIGTTIDNLSIKKKLIIIVAAFASSILIMSGIVYFAVDTLSTVRAIVEGESLWSKGQKDALYHLSRYVSTHDPQEYQKYKEYLSAPLADKQSRLELMKENPNFTIVEQGFAKGGIHPSETHAMSLFFKRFEFIDYVKKTVALWNLGDEEIAAIDKMAEELHRQISAGNIDQAELKLLFKKIDEQNVLLTTDSSRFLATLGEAARWLKDVIVMIIMITIICVLGFGLSVAYFISKKILLSIEELQSGTMRIGQGKFEQPMKVSSQDELGNLAAAFNKMSENLKKTILDLEEAKKIAVISAHETGMAQAANNAKSVFLENISHELRTPMHGILSFARFGQQKIESAPKDKLKSYFDEIHESGSHLMNLLNDLIELSQLERSRVFYSMKENNLVEAAKTVLNELSSCADEKKLKLQLVESTSPVVGQFDQARITHVLRNIIGNAIKFSHPNGTISVECLSLDDKNKCIITNYGIEIPKSEIESIFDKFAQSSKTKTGAGGTGLGLAICKEIIQQHNGNIWAESNSDGLTKFHFEFPRNHNEIKKTA